MYFIFLRRNCIAKENTSVPWKTVGDRETHINKTKKKIKLVSSRYTILY